MNTAIEEQLSSELAPKTDYETLMAQNIVANERQDCRLRHTRGMAQRHRADDRIAMHLQKLPKADAPGVARLG